MKALNLLNEDLTTILFNTNTNNNTNGTNQSGSGSNGSVKLTLNSLYKIKFYHLLGLLYYKQSKQQSITMTEKNSNLQLAIKLLLHCMNQSNSQSTSNSVDYKLHYHLSLIYSEMRELKLSFSHVKQSLALNSDYETNKQSWILLALLFSTNSNSTSNTGSGNTGSSGSGSNLIQSFKIIKMILLESINYGNSNYGNFKLKLLYARMEELMESSSMNQQVLVTINSQSNEEESTTALGNVSQNGNYSKSVKTYSKLSDELFKYLDGFDTIMDNTNNSTNTSKNGKITISISEYRQLKIDVINYYLFISDALRRKKLLDDATFNMSKAKDLMIELVEEIEEIESLKISSLSSSLSGGNTITTTGKKNKANSSANGGSGVNGLGLVEPIQKTSRDYMTIIDLLLNSGRLQKDESQQELIGLLKKANAMIHAIEGRLYEDSGKIKDAIIEYEAALINDPDCEIAHLRLGILFYKPAGSSTGGSSNSNSGNSGSASATHNIAVVEKQTTLARNYLQNAVRINPTNHLAWYHLGRVLSEHFNDDEEASDCFMTSLNYEKTSPVIDFSSDFLTLLV